MSTTHRAIRLITHLAVAAVVTMVAVVVDTTVADTMAVVATMAAAVTMVAAIMAVAAEVAVAAIMAETMAVAAVAAAAVANPDTSFSRLEYYTQNPGHTPGVFRMWFQSSRQKKTPTAEAMGV